MDISTLLLWARNPSLLGTSSLFELRLLLRRHPSCALSKVLYLENLFLLGDPLFRQELHRLALQIPDPALLYGLTEGAHLQSAQPVQASAPVLIPSPAEPEGAAVSSGVSAVLPDAGLLAQIQADSPSVVPPSGTPEQKAPPIFEMPFLTDYMAYLEKSGKDPQPQSSSTQDLDSIMARLDETIGKRSTPHQTQADGPVPLSPAPRLDFGDAMDESCLTQTMAGIFIRQKRYDKALEILEKISLANPRKNAYFADQIRFLHLLINCTKTNK